MKFVFSITLALALLTSAPALADGKIDVMTQNQYLGADLTGVIGAGDFAEFVAEAQKALQQAAANNFPERAEALAQLIANRSPDVVGLQEVFDFTIDPDGPGPIPPQRPGPPFVDHLAATLAALDVLGETYVPIAQVQNLNIALPLPGVGLVGVTDRDVILVREDLAGSAEEVDFSAACVRPSADGGPGCNYQEVVGIPLLPGTSIERGWVGIDIEVDGMLHRVVNTHLEVQNLANPGEEPAQQLQAEELIDTLETFLNEDDANIIVIGDINSSPEDSGAAAPYMQLVEAGYTDAWTLRPGATTGKGYVQGLSCCQLDDLSNHQSILDERIDVIFSAAVPNKVKKARVAGDRVSDKTPDSDLWPSDHGSVGAELQFE